MEDALWEQRGSAARASGTCVDASSTYIPALLIKTINLCYNSIHNTLAHSSLALVKLHSSMKADIFDRN